MKKTLLAVTLCMAAVCATGCNKKKSGGGSSGKVTTEVVEKALKGAVSVGANAVALGDGTKAGSGDYKPSDTSANCIKLATKKSFTLDSASYDFTYDYTFKMGNPLSGKNNWSDYAAPETKEGDYRVLKSNLFTPNTITDHSKYTYVEISIAAKCGDSTSSAKANIYLCPMDKVAKKMSLADINTKDDTLGSYYWTKLDSEKSGDKAFKADITKAESGQAAFYVETWGKLVHATADGNWAILASGNDAIQIYQPSKCTDYKTSMIGTNVSVKASLSFGYGNTQISYVYEMATITDNAKYPVTEPDLNQNFDSMITSADWVDHMMCNNTGYVENALFGKADGTPFIYTAKNTSQGGDTGETQIQAADIAAASSHTGFYAHIGTKEFRVEFDYHSCKDSGLADAVKTYISGLKSNDNLGKLYGCLRWLNSRELAAGNDYCVHTTGVWRLTPYLASQLPTK